MPKPNILIFMTDHQRGDTVLAEHPSITPNLTDFGREAITFTNAFCPSPHCCPSRATFFSGLYPSRHGVWNNICNTQALSHGPREGVKLWSEDLAEAGYNLAFSGKWHVSVNDSPADRGFRELIVNGKKGDNHGQTWENYEHLSRQGDQAQRGEGQILRPGYPTYTAYGSLQEKMPGDSRTVAEAIKVMPELAASGKPWGLFVGCVGPHDPYFVPQKYLDMYRIEDVPLPASYSDDLADKPRVYQRMRRMRWGQLSELEIRQAIRHFWAYCTYLDDMFGQVLQALERTGQADNTLVLYCSDHGDYCGDHGLFCKGIPAFRGAYHVPAVIRWPAGVTRPGRRVEEFVSLADFAPTFLDVAGVQAHRSFSGRSVVPLLRGQTPSDWRDDIGSQCNGVELYYTQRAIWTRDFKYVWNGFDEDELYDLRTDPDEMKNLACQKDYDAIKRQMCRRMWQFACREDDSAISSYITVGLAPYGPAEAFRQNGNL